MLSKQITESKKIPIGVHVGNILHFIMQTYPKPEDIIRELAQNSIDERPKNVRIIINEQDSSILCIDDGDGASQQNIVDIWSKVGISMKSARRGQIGEKGIAKLSGLSIAQEYLMITKPRRIKDSNYFSVTVDQKDFRNNEHPELVINEFAPGFSHQSKTKVSFKPTTSVLLKWVNKSAFKELSNLDSLAEYLGDYFSEVIAQKGVNLLLIFKNSAGTIATVQVRPREFPGTKQKELSIITSFGPVSFEIYTTLKPISKYKIYVAHSTGSKFLLKKMENLWRQVGDVLGSGFYQGIIRCGFCELRADREGFESGVREDAFIEAVIKYVQENCEPYLAEMKNYSRHERYAQVIKNTVDYLDLFIKNNPEVKLQLGLQGLVSGSHIGAENGDPTDELFRQRAPRFDEIPKLTGQNAKPSPPKKENKQMMHPAYPHPTGRHKKKIKGQQGISIGYKEADDTTGYSWRTRVDEGTIFFNISHEDWRNAEDKSNYALQQYVNLHTIKELSILMAPEHQAKQFRDVFEKYVTQFSPLLCMR